MPKTPVHYEFEVEYHIPLPVKGDYRRRYPFRELKQVGCSFMVPCDVLGMEKMWNTLTRSQHWASYKTGWKFTMRRVLGGIRIWRIE